MKYIKTWEDAELNKLYSGGIIDYLAGAVGSRDDVYVLQGTEEQIVGHEAAAQLLQRQRAHDGVTAYSSG